MLTRKHSKMDVDVIDAKTVVLAPEGIWVTDHEGNQLLIEPCDIKWEKDDRTQINLSRFIRYIFNCDFMSKHGV
jgi:hypothetical protein